MVVARITTKGQITIPKEIRDRLAVEAGDGLEFRVHGDRVEVLPVKRHRLAEFRGIFRVERALDFDEERKLARSSRIKHEMLEDSAHGG